MPAWEDPLRPRPATETDVPLLPAVERDAAQSYLEVGYDFCATGPVRSLEEHRRGLAEGTLLVVDEAAGAGLVAFALAWPLDGRAHLVELAVRRSHQRRGLGRQLVAAVEAWAAARGFSELTLTTFRDVAWNAPYYRRLGFEDLEVGPDRPALRALQADERAAGFAIRPRLAMRKHLAL